MNGTSIHIYKMSRWFSQLQNLNSVRALPKGVRQYEKIKNRDKWDVTMDEHWINNVLLVLIDRPVWYTIYHYLPVVSRVNKPLYESTNQWEFESLRSLGSSDLRYR